MGQFRVINSQDGNEDSIVFVKELAEDRDEGATTGAHDIRCANNSMNKNKDPNTINHFNAVNILNPLYAESSPLSYCIILSQHGGLPIWRLFWPVPIREGYLFLQCFPNVWALKEHALIYGKLFRYLGHSETWSYVRFLQIHICYSLSEFQRSRVDKWPCHNDKWDHLVSSPPNWNPFLWALTIGNPYLFIWLCLANYIFCQLISSSVYSIVFIKTLMTLIKLSIPREWHAETNSVLCVPEVRYIDLMSTSPKWTPSPILQYFPNKKI